MPSTTGATPSPGLSIVIPSYNSARWLPATLRAVDAAVVAAELTDVEVIVVNDGSTDDTVDVVTATTPALHTPLRLISTANQGRFLARWTGVSEARHDEVMLVDSRVLVAETALRHIRDVRAAGGGLGPWNAHAETSPDAALVGLFWEVPTYVFWGEYRANPRPMTITPDNFDRVPKGTTCFLLSRALYQESARAAWPTTNAHLVSDDTMILRHVVQAGPINLDPGFRVEYLPRQSVRQFLTHSFVRGTLFVSSYGGTSRLRDAILALLALAPGLALALLAIAWTTGWLPWALIGILCALALAVLAPTLVALRRGCTPRAATSFLCLIPAFGTVFWAGICRGLVVHRATWRGRPATLLP